MKDKEQAKSNRLNGIKKANEKKAEIRATKKEKFISILKESMGNRSFACNKVGIERSTFNLWYNSDPDFKEKIDEIDEYIIDFAESKLHQNINNNDTTSIIFFLKTRGKKRGYIEKVQQELSGDSDKPIVTINYIQPKQES